MGVGRLGFSQSSGVHDIMGIWLEFRTTLLNPCFRNGRGFGLQLRCLSE